MRVRVNFTVDFDLDEYRQKTNQSDLTTADVRALIQNDAAEWILEALRQSGVKATSLGQNNAYDPETRQTIHEEYVNT